MSTLICVGILRVANERCKSAYDAAYNVEVWLVVMGILDVL
jgi:hypothetical protein